MIASLVPGLLCGGGEKKEPGTHCLPMLSSPRIYTRATEDEIMQQIVSLCCVVTLLTFVLQSL